MTLKIKRASGLVDLGGSATPAPPALPDPTYVRPADWLALPVVNLGEEKFVGLYAVRPDDASYVSVLAAGAYTVDWGDGSAVQNFAANAQANHQYLWANAPAGSVTADGLRQVVVTITPQAGQNLTTLDLSQRHPSLSGASPQPTGWLDMRMSGANVANLWLSVNSVNTALVQHRYLRSFEYIGPSQITTMINKFKDCARLQQVVGSVWTTAATSFNNCFTNCYRLRVAPWLVTGASTNFGQMFQNCTQLQSVPLYDTANSTAMNSMFNTCNSLRSVPKFNTAKVTTFVQMFFNARSLAELPDFDYSAATTVNQMCNNAAGLRKTPTAINLPLVVNAGSMFSICRGLMQGPDTMSLPNATDISNLFNDCGSLAKAPALYTPKATNAASIFSQCYGLVSVPVFDTSKVTDFNNGFNNCLSLQVVPALDLSLCVNMSNAFANVQSCTVFPDLNLPACNNLSSAFSGCWGMVKAPMLTLAAANINMTSCFSSCLSLESVPAYNTATVITFTNVFSQCPSLRRLPAWNVGAATSTMGFAAAGSPSVGGVDYTNIVQTIDVSNMRLSAAELNHVYGNLATVAGKTITVSGNPGIAGDDPTIATAKGWTVTGS